MAKLGLKDTLMFLAAGYKKKDIDALAAIDDEQATSDLSQKSISAPVPDEKPASDPVPQAEEKPDNELKQVKAQLDDTLKKLKESEEKISKLQQDNVHKDSAPASEEAKQKEHESLLELFRGSM